MGYEIQKQIIILLEVRPIWNEPSKVLNEPYAKATYIKKSDRWKVYWMRGNLQWFSYGPKPEVRKLTDFLKLVDEDEYCCFKG